jgi:hypothetical protein
VLGEFAHDFLEEHGNAVGCETLIECGRHLLSEVYIVLFEIE